jgi:hypothetical protein
MPSPMRQVLLNLTERLDEELLPTLYAAASIGAADIQAELDLRSEPRLGGEVEPEPHELESTSRNVIQRSCRRAAARGALAGAGGLLAVPPEAAASVVQSIRLAQRLVVVWGFDPDTDLGQIHVARALAAAYEVELPDQGPIDMRVRDIARLGTPKVPELRNQTTALVQVLAQRSVVTLVKRYYRWIPGIGAGLGALGAHRGLRKQGERMVAYLRRTRGISPRVSNIEDAVEVHTS